ncbi:hypothetical protein PHET_06223 [Paragonimus heterotremus]|uniref:Rab3 GTPase-activating protein catalytic subunit n=1 Tax=Paragonimus heterotremus TaxID=100268 RepID=A0A8J4T6W2_9TREM|nr:hypothetical protein PHET_06223 [Paragonimus heterotremus]
MTSVSSVYPLVHLATVWPRVPSHAVTQRASWTVLKPEGAPEWYLQLFIQTSHADRLSSRLKLFSRTCRDCEPTENSTRASSAVYMPTSLSKELSYTVDNVDDITGVFRWSRKQNRGSPKVTELAHKLGLPPATSLTHRLAVLMCNLYFQQPIPTNPGLLEVMFSEFILELKLRLDRLISLPDCSAYVDSEDAIYEAGCSSDHKRASTYLNIVDSVDVGFEYWSEDEQLNLYKVLERFNTCIQKARPLSHVKCEDADFGRTVAKEVDEESSTTDAEDAFFDAEEDIESLKRGDNSDSETLRAVSVTQTTSDEAIEEARCILQWLQSMGRVQFMRLLMPSVCLEALITLHSITPHTRLVPWYSRALEELVTQLNVILARLTDGRTSLDGYTNCEEVMCPILSDDTLSFLCDLASGAVCGQTDWTAHSTGWVLVDRASRSFTDFQSLCGLKTPSKASGSQSTKPVISPFQFTSSAQSWFANDPPLDLRQPTWETYVLRTNIGQPNPLASRLGPQRLCVELNSEDVRKRQYDRLLVAGAFSYDTQFF